LRALVQTGALGFQKEKAVDEINKDNNWIHKFRGVTYDLKITKSDDGTFRGHITNRSTGKYCLKDFGDRCPSHYEVEQLIEQDPLK